MNTEALFLFLILLLGLVFCSFLGGNCGNEGFTSKNHETNVTQQHDNNNKKYTKSTDGSSTSYNVKYDNYNHYNGSSSKLANGTTFYGRKGGSVVVNIDSNGEQSLQVTLERGQQPMTFSSQEQSSSVRENYTNYGNNGTSTTFYGPNGATATVVNLDKGEQAINVKTSSGSYTYTQSGSSYHNLDNITSTQYYGSTGTPIQSSGTSLAYKRPYERSSGSQGNTDYYDEGSYENTFTGTNFSNPSGTYGTEYYNSLPAGIPINEIPLGKEDLYILKSQVVPPVCPVCPVAASYPRQEKCPPCPACARCPESAFECKKVPNYNAVGSDQLPMAVLNDFSSFGM
jgi:hypothetical protein